MEFEYIHKKLTNIRIYSYPNFLMVRIFEYIRIPIILYSYSNIKYSAKNIRIFEYIRIFATLWLFLWGGWVVKFLTPSHFCHMSFFGGGGWVLKEIWSMSLNNPFFFLAPFPYTFVAQLQITSTQPFYNRYFFGIFQDTIALF